MDRNKTANVVSVADYGRMTAALVSAYVKHNGVPASDLAELITSTADALIGLATPDVLAASAAEDMSQAKIRRSITHEALISFEDGKRYKTLKRHLTAYGLTPEMYRAKWGLPIDYPMVAPGYSERRSAIAVTLQRRYGNHRTARTTETS
ncbi:MucR family transcriptional regulator [Methylobacterium sp. P1-11]|uniref:MucR family transcriptional regulator n=1 Tax=Methylobacterium sp. P1-11 TaxID=2024616 RepID=UPI0011EF93F5|nr:MucR family transcriptional regulator [Methylobacterium sp. P1-11]KAA0121852.1 MucR family transcriptional regulator [Methylobacterium sp. P1-11]